jgi:hypothetical protein
MKSITLQAAKRILATPTVKLLDTASDVLFKPSRIARLASRQDSHFQAGGFFVKAVSSAIILTSISHWILGIGGLIEIFYWLVQLIFVSSVITLAWCIALPANPPPGKTFIFAACYTYGTSYLLGAIFLCSAAMTLQTLHWFNIIPPFKYDPLLWAHPEYLKSATNEIYQCLRQASSLFDLFYNGLGGQFEALHFPISGLSYVQPVSHLVLTLIYARIIALASTNRSSWGAFSVLASVTITTVGISAFGSYYTRYLEESTDCVRTSIRHTLALSAEGQVKTLAQKWRPDLNIDKGGPLLTAVEQDEKTLILRFRVDPSKVGASSFIAFVGRIRKRRLNDYCSSNWGKYYRRIGISEVWIYKYGDSEIVARVIQNADQCRR